jgi:hypothetical protein
MEKLSDIYTNMRLQNVEGMMELVCHELDNLRMSGVRAGPLPLVTPFSVWPLVATLIFKFIMLIFLFFIMVSDYWTVEQPVYHSDTESKTEEENNSENNVPE